MIWRNFKMAINSLYHSKLRSFLTMLGIIIGVSSVIVVLATGEGIKQQIVGESERLGANIINITPGQTFSEEGGFNLAASLGVSTLTEADVETVRNIETVESAAPITLISGVPSHQGQAASNATIMATTPELAEVLRLELTAGRFLEAATEDDEEEQPESLAEAVLGYWLSEQLFDSPDAAIGETLLLREREFTIVGVLEEPADSFMLSTDAQLAGSAFISFEAGKDIAGGVSNIIEIDALASSPEVLDETVEAIKTALRQNRGGEEDFTVLTLEEFADAFDAIFGAVATFIAAVAGISLLVGGIGVANIMLVTVTERTREIGIRKAIGATRGHLMLQFLIEAVALSLIGGALGVAAAFGLVQVIQAQLDITAVFTPFAFLLALGVSLGVGVVFGLVPAIKAALKDPIKALRYE